MTFASPTPIAFCITELNPGGAERALVELVTRLDRREFSPAVFCLGPKGPLAEELERREVPVTCFDATRGRDVWVLYRLWRALRAFRPVILQTWLYHANLLGRLAGRCAHVPIIVSGIRVAERRFRRRLWADRLSQCLVDAHVCVSRDVAKFSISQGGLNASRVHTIRNGVEVARFASAEPADLAYLNISPQSKVILFVGRLDTQKDPLWLLNAFSLLKSSLADVHLIYVGEGVLEPVLRETIQREQLEDSAHLLGRRADVPNLLKAADVLVLPSRWEGMPNVVLEAFAAGTPVVAANVEGVSELITPRETGLLVTSKSTDELAARILELLQDSLLITKVRHSAQKLVTEKFKWENTCERYRDLYRELLKTHRGPE